MLTSPFQIKPITPHQILLIDDDSGILTGLKWGFRERFPDAQLRTASSVEEAKLALSSQAPDLVVLDLGLPPDPDNASEGLKILQFLNENRGIFFKTKVIAYSGTTRSEHAAECARYNAFFLSKSSDTSMLMLTAEMLLLNATLLQNHLENTCEEQKSSVIGNCDGIKLAIKKIEKIADTDINVLILGESGTGKEVFARMIHEQSGRTGAFIAINCAAIPADLLENELFGHEKGAFTGAATLKKGKVEAANGGTLFLDEIGDMPLNLQAKILRFLQEGTVDRVGGTMPIDVDVRVVCATHRDLDLMIDTSTFRRDLYYRIAKTVIELPALRDRKNDIIALAKYYLKKSCEKYPKFHVDGFSPSAVNAMLDYRWPGNIRELQNKIGSAIMIADGALLTASDLELPLCDDSFRLDLPQEQIEDASFEVQLAAFEQKILYDALQKHGSPTTAAKQLKIGRSTFYNRWRKAKELLNSGDLPGTFEDIE